MPESRESPGVPPMSEGPDATYKRKDTFVEVGTNTDANSAAETDSDDGSDNNSSSDSSEGSDSDSSSDDDSDNDTVIDASEYDRLHRPQNIQQDEADATSPLWLYANGLIRPLTPEATRPSYFDLPPTMSNGLSRPSQNSTSYPEHVQHFLYLLERHSALTRRPPRNIPTDPEELREMRRRYSDPSANAVEPLRNPFAEPTRRERDAEIKRLALEQERAEIVAELAMRDRQRAERQSNGRGRGENRRASRSRRERKTRRRSHAVGAEQEVVVKEYEVPIDVYIFPSPPPGFTSRAIRSSHSGHLIWDPSENGKLSTRFKAFESTVLMLAAAMGIVSRAVLKSWKKVLGIRFLDGKIVAFGLLEWARILESWGAAENSLATKAKFVVVYGGDLKDVDFEGEEFAHLGTETSQENASGCRMEQSLSDRPDVNYWEMNPPHLSTYRFSPPSVPGRQGDASHAHAHASYPSKSRAHIAILPAPPMQPSQITVPTLLATLHFCPFPQNPPQPPTLSAITYTLPAFPLPIFPPSTFPEFKRFLLKQHWSVFNTHLRPFDPERFCTRIWVQWVQPESFDQRRGEKEARGSRFWKMKVGEEDWEGLCQELGRWAVDQPGILGGLSMGMEGWYVVEAGRNTDAMSSDDDDDGGDDDDDVEGEEGPENEKEREEPKDKDPEASRAADDIECGEASNRLFNGWTFGEASRRHLTGQEEEEEDSDNDSGETFAGLNGDGACVDKLRYTSWQKCFEEMREPAPDEAVVSGWPLQTKQYGREEQ